MNIEAIVKDLKSKGLPEEQVLKSLEQLVAEGQLTTEDFENAKKMLAEKAEKQKASELFGLKF